MKNFALTLTTAALLSLSAASIANAGPQNNNAPACIDILGPIGLEGLCNY